MDTALNYCDTRSKKLMKSLDFSSDNSMSTDGQLAVEVPPGEQDFRRRLNKEKHSTPIHQKPIPQPRKSRTKSLASSRTSDSEGSSYSSYSRTSSSKTNDEPRHHETAPTTTMRRSRREGSDCDEISSADIELWKAQIDQLTTELKVEKRKGNKINEKLLLCQSELTSARTELELEKLNKDGYGNGVISDAVEDLYRAQKERELSMVARIQQAQKERDEAVLRAKAYMKDITNKEDSPRRNVKNSNVDKLIDSICSAETPRSAQKMSQELSDYWLNIIKEKKENHEEQVRSLMNERDVLRRKLHITNQELEELKRNLVGGGGGKVTGGETTSQHVRKIAQLNSVIAETESERDSMKKQLSKVQDDLETVRLQFSLEHSLKRHQLTNEDRNGKGDAARLCESLRIANEQHRLLKENSERMKMKIEILTENNKKHERHINVLRRKLAAAAERASTNTNERRSKEKTRNIL